MTKISDKLQANSDTVILTTVLVAATAVILATIKMITKIFTR